MGRHRRALMAGALLAVLTACGGYGPPRNLDDACALVEERPRYLKAMERTQERWSVPVPVQMATIYQESKFVGDARTPMRYAIGVIPMGRQSSAYGYAQALDGTWDDYRKDTGRWRAKRDRFDDAVDFMGWYMTRTEAKLGIPTSDARNQYLAYHEGHTGYARGSYNRKSWLVRVSDQVAARADLYAAQLISCGRM